MAGFFKVMNQTLISVEAEVAGAGFGSPNFPSDRQYPGLQKQRELDHESRTTIDRSRQKKAVNGTSRGAHKRRTNGAQNRAQGGAQGHAQSSVISAAQNLGLSPRSDQAQEQGGMRDLNQ